MCIPRIWHYTLIHMRRTLASLSHFGLSFPSISQNEFKVFSCLGIQDHTFSEYKLLLISFSVMCSPNSCFLDSISTNDFYFLQELFRRMFLKTQRYKLFFSSFFLFWVKFLKRQPKNIVVLWNFYGFVCLCVSVCAMCYHMADFVNIPIYITKHKYGLLRA